MSLTEEEMMETMNEIMEGQFSDEQLEDFLVDLAERGETVQEITGAARVLREKASTIEAPPGTVDCCGTGGDGAGTYNISTAVAFVVAACGVPIAKHGNRASSSKSGAADILEALGVNLDLDQNQLETALTELNYAFLMAPHHHQAMKHVASVRQKLEHRTIFNLLGPLANPAGTNYQLIGVYDQKWVTPIAETLRNLGTKRAWVVHGADGLDEITTTSSTHVAVLDEDGAIVEKELTPAEFGLEVSQLEDLRGGEASENAEALQDIFEGQRNAYRDIVLANAAAVLCIYNSELGLKEAVQRAEDAIDFGQALDVLESYAAFSRGNPIS